MARDDVVKQLDRNGRLPRMKLEVKPLESSRKPFSMGGFISYGFNSNILIPVDTFTATVRPPPPKSERETWDRLIKGGDIVQLTINDTTIATGYVGSTDISTDESGSRLTLHGRDMMGMMEDNDAVNPDATILWSNVADIGTVMEALLRNTRIRGYETVNMTDDRVKGLFASNPGESKLAALQRFLDPLNAVAWMAPDGTLRVGRPSFDAQSSGTIAMRAGIGPQQRGRGSNFLSMRTVRSEAELPNAVLSIWAGMESVQAAVSTGKLKQNSAEGPASLYRANHKIFRTIVTSAPDANDTKSGLTEVQRIISQGSNYLDSLAARELARENVRELIVTAVAYGHLNADGEPYAPDQIYHVIHDVAGLDKKMYLFGVEYALAEDGGCTTTLSFCNLNTIVAGGPVFVDAGQQNTSAGRFA